VPRVRPHRRATFSFSASPIVRRISWTPDSRSIYAAVADIDADVILLSGLIR
jgi:hypothetical protein